MSQHKFSKEKSFQMKKKGRKRKHKGIRSKSGNK